MVEYPSDWKVAKLSDAVMVNPQAESQIPEEFFYVDLESVKSGCLLQKNRVLRAQAPSRAQRQFQNGDILFQTVRPYQRNNLLVDFQANNFIASTGYAVLRSLENKSDSSYVYACLNSDWFVDSVLDNCTGTSYPAINPQKLSQIKIPLPPLPEQKRIAKVLDDVDRLIENLGKRIAKKRLIKKGIAQELLTGKKRLPGFGGAWKTVKLGDVCSITTGHKDVNVSSEQGQYPFFSCSKKVYRADTYTFDGEAIMVAGNGDVGNLHYFNGKFEAYQRTYVLMGFKEDIGFVWQCLDANLMTMLSEGKVGSSMPYIVLEQLAGFKFPLPPFVEQRAIAKVLSDMDEEIANLEARQSKLKLVKKGVLQDLLTGKVRLK